MASSAKARKTEGADVAATVSPTRAKTQGADATATPVATHEVFYVCKYTPLELLRGFGAKVTLAEPDVDSFDEADALSHPNLCGYGKGLICRLIEPDVHEVVLVSCCDVIRRVYDVLVEHGGYDFLYLLELPHRTGEREVALYRERLEALAQAYAAYTGTTFNAGAALAELEQPLPAHGPHVELLGAHAGPALIDAVASSLGTRVENGTCTGPRRLPSAPRSLARAEREGNCEACEVAAEAAADASSDTSLDAFLDWYAGALLHQTPCMRMADISERNELSQDATGIIYHTMKFCDYYGFEYASLMRQTETPIVKVETDGTSQSAGQLRTRLEAFGETIGTRSTGGHLEKEASMRVTDTDGRTLVLGIDLGSTSTKIVIMDGNRSIVTRAIIPTGARAAQAAEKGEAEVLRNAGITPDAIACRISTGYGRDGAQNMNSSVTEITCHARGARYLKSDVRTIIDIGGQDSKVIHLDESGAVSNFVMNDKCAAGTGRFLEAMARVLEMSLDEFCEVGLSWSHDVRITSMCTVFAESEVVSLVAENTPTPDIIHGLDMSVARKVTTLAKRVGAEPPYLMTGGVAQNEGVVQALGEVLGAPVDTHPDSQLCGAIGAALLGLDSLGVA